MSITRSPYRPAPATELAPPVLTRADRRRLLLIGHGSTRAAADNDTLLRHAERLAERSLFRSVDVGLLYGEPSAEALAARLPRAELFVVPFFMADGYYPQRVIPALFDNDKAADGNTERPIFCAPVGLHPGLAGIVMDRALEALEVRRLTPKHATLLVIGHGSENSPASWHATETQARRVRQRGVFRRVTTAYLEQSPEIAGVLNGLKGPVVAAGLFAGDGAHAGRDVPALLNGYRAGSIDYLGAIGCDPAIADLVLDQVADADPSFKH